MIVEIRPEDRGPGGLQANGFAIAYEAALMELRARFRDVRCSLVTFASGHPYMQQQRALAASAGARGEFHTIESWSFDRVKATAFYGENCDILSRTRGQGYWLWKPYVIHRALEASADGDLIAYSDCGPVPGNVIGGSILPTLAWLSGGERRLAVSRMHQPQSAWTKRDCFRVMDCDAPAYWAHDQLIASYMVFIANPSTRRLVDDWLRYCQDARVLTDDPNTCGADDFPDFQDHRHDQSVLTNLVIRDEFELPDLQFGRNITSKNLQNMLSVFEGALVQPPTRGDCVSLGKPWRQSSPSVWSPVTGVMTEHAEDRPFFFHTEAEGDPWWVLDLEADHRIERIEIVNRQVPPYGLRAKRMQVLLGSDFQNLDLVFDAVVSTWDLYSPLVLAPDDRTARFLKIRLDEVESLHLKSVRVFGRPA